MSILGLRSALLLCSSALLIATLTLASCRGKEHPDYRMAVYNALDTDNLRSVTVSQDRDAGTITLTGIVGNMNLRQQAEDVARQAAPGYQIADKIQIQSAASQDNMRDAMKNQNDSKIEDDFKSRISNEPSLKSEKIQYTAYNGTLTLQGTVRSTKEKQQAEELAKKVPQVQRVVNELQVRPGKPSPASS